MLELKGRKVLVMGLGLHGGGLGVTRFLLQEGALVTVTDLREAEDLAPTLRALEGESVQYVLGQHRYQDFVHTDMVVRNPAVPLDSPYLEEARRHGVPIEMEMTLFFARCLGPLVGVTGTKGKSTTTALLGHLLRQHYADTVVAGNIRVSALEALSEIQATTPVVLELSSWQLEGLGERGMSPRMSVVTNLYPDHLNRYPSWEAYVQAKKLIYQFQEPEDLLILNAEDTVVRGFAGDARSQVVWYGTELHRHGDGLRAGDGKVLPLGAGAALQVGQEFVWLDASGEQSMVCPRTVFPLPGQHNTANALAALAAAIFFGVAPPQIAAGLASFQGLSDRLEVVRVSGGVTYINDTTSTAPVSTIVALRALATPIVLIAGGADKALAYDEWAQVVADRVRAVILLEGTATTKIVQALRQVNAALLMEGPFDDLDTALRCAYQIARPGDTVLLSPGCASFGMFRHEFERGQRFREIVQSLPGGEM
jgi:UDP-N-acetylmuramoylalanine--D-glutamate ligase